MRHFTPDWYSLFPEPPAHMLLPLERLLARLDPSLHHTLSCGEPPLRPHRPAFTSSRSFRRQPSLRSNTPASTSLHHTCLYSASSHPTSAHLDRLLHHMLSCGVPSLCSDTPVLPSLQQICLHSTSSYLPSFCFIKPAFTNPEEWS